MDFMERVAPIVDETIKALAKVEFIPDPIAGTHYSRTTSIVSSAYKRHGKILEFALRESLRESNRHKVWNDEAFKVWREADALANTQDFESCRQSTLPYGNSVRTLQQGWQCWGDQVALFDNGTVSTRRQPSRLVDAPTLPF